MKILKYISFLAILLSAVACSDDDVFAPDHSPEVNPDGTITLDVSVSVPEMVNTHTRAMGETADYNNLQLYIIAFAKKSDGDPTANTYINNYKATNERIGDDGMLHFNVTLLQTNEPRVLHLIAVPDDVTLDLGKYGSEELISRLTVSGGNEAYWQRVVFPNGYGTVDDNGNFTLSDETKTKLTAVPMIRNFAQISVENSADNNFKLEGFMVVNTPSAGTVAPWYNAKFPEFLENKTQKDYESLDYPGILAGEAEFENTDVNAGSFTPEAKFLYERPKSSLNSTVIIVKGNYKNEGSSYYKIDLGKKADTGVFNVYNIIRNFKYIVTINKVTASGRETPGEALGGVTYNNLSFDFRTEKMLNISNGTSMLWVTQTTHVVTKEENRMFYFGYKYKSDINNNSVKQNNNLIDYSSLDITNPNLAGVVTSIKEFNGVPEGYAKDQYSDYKFFEITTTAIPTETLTGSFVVVNQETGLGRQVNIIVSPPFEITRNRIFAGNYNVPDQFPYNRLQWENKVEAEIGKPLTVFFTLDDNLPEAIFPLVFEIESNQQDIENNPIGTLVVSSGPSVFTEGKRRIKYQKVVTWQNYNDELSADNPFGLIVPDKLNDHNGNKKIRRVRCRLRTINSVDTETETTLRITNPYFKQGKWTKIDWNGNNLDIIKASDIIEVKYTRDPSNNPIGVPDYTDWNSSLIP
nr:hypothetical protein Muribac2_100 [uncultured Muribaculaceae bacterium]